MSGDRDEPLSRAILAAADELIDEFGAVDLLELADAVEDAADDEQDGDAFRAVAAELRRRAAAGVRFRSDDDGH